MSVPLLLGAGYVSGYLQNQLVHKPKSESGGSQFQQPGHDLKAGNWPRRNKIIVH
jgi:hypothetical protein